MFKKTTSIVILIVLSMVLIACDDKPKEATTTQATKNSQEVVKTDSKAIKSKNSEYIEAINNALAKNKTLGCFDIPDIYKKLPYGINGKYLDYFEKVGLSQVIETKTDEFNTYKIYNLTEEGYKFYNEEFFCLKGADIVVNEIIDIEDTEFLGIKLRNINFTFKFENKANWLKVIPELNEADEQGFYNNYRIINNLINNEKKEIYTATIEFHENDTKMGFSKKINTSVSIFQ